MLPVFALLLLLSLLGTTVSAETQIAQIGDTMNIYATYGREQQMLLRGRISNAHPLQILDSEWRVEAFLLNTLLAAASASSSKNTALFLGLNIGVAQQSLYQMSGASFLLSVEPDRDLFLFYETLSETMKAPGMENVHTVSLGNPYNFLAAMIENDESFSVLVEDIFDGALMGVPSTKHLATLQTLAPLVVKHAYNCTTAEVSALANAYASYRLNPSARGVILVSLARHSWIISGPAVSCNTLRKSPSFTSLAIRCDQIVS